MRLMRCIALMVAAAIFGAIVTAAEPNKATEQAEKSSQTPLELRVAGAKILNSKGEEVILRGVNAASLEWTSDGDGHILETARVAIDDWKVNIIRLPLSQDRWFGKAPEQNDTGVAYRKLVKDVVDLCGSKGCYIMLDLHWSNAGKWGENIGQHSMPDKYSIDFWKDFAAVYANNPAVLFDLYNEPHDVNWEVWLKGGTIKDRPNRPGLTAVTYEAVGMQQLLDTVRATGAKNVIVAGGLDWAYDLSGILDGRQLKDPNGNGVIYANHAYDNKRESVFKWKADMERATKVLPVIVSEFGGSGGPNRSIGWWGTSPSTAIGDDWLMHVLHIIKEHNWSFTAWDMHTTAAPTLISDWSYTPTPDFGIFVKQLLVENKLPAYTPPDVMKVTMPPASTLPPTARTGVPELYGDWKIEPAPGERQSSILSFAPNSQGHIIGQWINFRGFTELADVRFDNNSISFTQSVRFEKDEYRALFTGSIKDGTLTGKLLHGVGQSEIKAHRSKEIPAVVGSWQMIIKADGNETVATLAVKAEPNSQELSAEWLDEQGKYEISDIKFEQDKLAFTRKSTIGDRISESNFTGTVKPNAGELTGIIKAGDKEISVSGKRIGSTLIGTWALDVEAPWGVSRQRLKINPDLSAVYGTAPVEKVNIEGSKVTFKLVFEFGRRKMEMDFEGKLAGPSLTGELKNQMGAQKITGKKLSHI